MTSEDRYSVHVLNVILGGGHEFARFFRPSEKITGLAYAVYSGVNTYTDAGYLSMMRPPLPSRSATL